MQHVNFRSLAEPHPFNYITKEPPHCLNGYTIDLFTVHCQPTYSQNKGGIVIVSEFPSFNSFHPSAFQYPSNDIV